MWHPSDRLFAKESLSTHLSHDRDHGAPGSNGMQRTAAEGAFDFQHDEQNTGGTKFPTRIDLSAHHPETGEELGHARYYPPKRRNAPLHIDEVDGHAPGAASALLNEIEARHPGSPTKFLHEVRRNNNNPDVTGHAHEHAGQPTDWDTHYPGLADTVHRGLVVRLPRASARVVNSADATKEDHLAELHAALPPGPSLGMHWTENGHAAQQFAHNAVSDARTDIPVVLHAHTPAQKDLETRRDHLYRGGVFPYGDAHSQENEVPLRKGRKVSVTGISWRPDAAHPDADDHGWVHHTYDEPVQHTGAVETPFSVWHMATQELDQVTDEPEADVSDLPHTCSYCGSQEFETPENTGRGQRAVCSACGGAMLRTDDGQWTPAGPGATNNHPRPEGDPNSGGVGGAANVGVDPDRMNDASARHGSLGPFSVWEISTEHTAADGTVRPVQRRKGARHRSANDTRFIFTPSQRPEIDDHSLALHRGDQELGHLKWRGTDGDISTVDVHRDHRRQGIATQLYTKAHELAQQHGFTGPAGTAFQTPEGHDFRAHFDTHDRPDVSHIPTETSFGSGAGKTDLAQHMIEDHGFHNSADQVRGMKASALSKWHDNVRQFDSCGWGRTAALNDEIPWCAHLYHGNCTYPGDKLPNGTILGIPQDRGPCPWKQSVSMQAVCPISEPGPMAVQFREGGLHEAMPSTKHTPPNDLYFDTHDPQPGEQHFDEAEEKNPGWSHHLLRAHRSSVDNGGSQPHMVGSLYYSHQSDGPVPMVKVHKMRVAEQHRSQGIASAMQDELHRQYPGHFIDHGDRTDDGHGWAAQYETPSDHIMSQVKTSSWTDVREKAQRIRREGRVTIIVASTDGVAGEVKGDEHVYETAITWVPGTNRTAAWSCGCKWGAYAWGPTWDGRPCSHVLAMRFEAQSRSAHGREIELDQKRPDWLSPQTSIVVQYERPSDKHPDGRDLTRRAVPPGNMRSEWSGRSRTRRSSLHSPAEIQEIVARAFAEAKARLDGDDDPAEVLGHLITAGIPHDDAQNIVLAARGRVALRKVAKKCPECGAELDATDSQCDDCGAVLPDQSVTHKASWGDDEQRCPHCGGFIGPHAFKIGKCPHCGHALAHKTGAAIPPGWEGAQGPFEDEYNEPHVYARDIHSGAGNCVCGGGLGDSIHLQAAPGVDVPEHQRTASSEIDYRPHRTQDARSDAPVFGKGVDDWGLTLVDCPQCGGKSGCGHCGGTGQVISTGGTTANPTPDQNPVAGDAIREDGISDTSSLRPEFAATSWWPSFVIEGLSAEETPSVSSVDHHGLGGIEVPLGASGLSGVHGGRGLPRVEVVGGGLHTQMVQSNAKSVETSLASRRTAVEIPVVARMIENELGWDLSDTQQPHEAVQIVVPFFQDRASVAVPTSGSSPHVTSIVRNEYNLPKDAVGKQKVPTVAGLWLKAADTGRVLMLQRGLEDRKDPARGLWESPGGHIEPQDETSLHAGIREWTEEVGQPFPSGGVVTHAYTSPNGIYQGHVVVIPRERDLVMHDGRIVPNPDDPKGDNAEQAAWWDIDHARKNPALRPEVKATPWNKIKEAGSDCGLKVEALLQRQGAAWDSLYSLEEAQPVTPPPHSDSENPISSGFLTTQDPQSWSEVTHKPHHLMPADSLDSPVATLHSVPEGALPFTDGDIEDSTSGTTDEYGTQTNDDDTQSLDGDTDGIPDTEQEGSPMEPLGGIASKRSVADIVEQFQRTAGAQMLQSGSGGGSDVGFSDGEIAAKAKERLAGLSKTALKNFTFDEQQELIGEGKGTRARNFGDLDVTGTHYQAINEALAAADLTDDDILIL